MISYDYPFNERIRTLLRLEHLFASILHCAKSQHDADHHCALLGMFHVLDVIDRVELKTDLLQELDRQKFVLDNLRGNPVIAEEVLATTLREIEQTAQLLRTTPGKIGQPLRDSDWLMSIKQRAIIPGGVCEFDVPSYHYWRGLPAEKRQQDLHTWLYHLMPLHDSLRIILRILRGSGAPTKFVAPSGTYQQMLGGAKLAQMLRVKVLDDTPCFPEVSANKYAINIRFNALDGMHKPKQYEHDVNFELTLCNL
ncbi:MAG: cell division protein ZapD [Methylobacillus sp.]|nr:cell division protein ZapD [Methylobacillus sp.]